MKRLIIIGSPRTEGRSAHLAEMLFEANIDEHPEDELFLVPVSEIDVGPCVGCNACREKIPVILKNDAGDEVSVEKHRCVFDDDMQTLYDLIDDADELTVVSPVYFSGAPAPLKCLLDRLQPYYWAKRASAPGGESAEGGSSADSEGAAGGGRAAKRPATLHVVGEGGDPHGYGALVSEVTSALAIAGFRLERILDWVGRIDANGEITAEAQETLVGKRRNEPSVAGGAPGASSTSGAPGARPLLKLQVEDPKPDQPRYGQPSSKPNPKSKQSPNSNPKQREARKPPAKSKQSRPQRNASGKGAGNAGNKGAGKRKGARRG